MKSPEYCEKWKRSYVEERVATCEVAARFLAERYGNPHEDIIELVYSRERDCFTTAPHVDISDEALTEQIKEFMNANPRLSRWVYASGVLHTLKGLCHWWAEREAAEAAE
jgi:hypothetical protein